MKKWSLLSAIALSLIVFQSCGDGTNDNDTAIEDNTANSTTVNDSMAVNDDRDDVQEFVVESAQRGMFEVELANLAKEKATNAEVKKFASTLATDHAKINDELKSLASQKSITVPSALDNDRMDKLNKLKEKSGAEFDKDYMNLVIDIHQNDIDEFEDETDDKDDDAAIKSFASKHLPHLKSHLDEAKRIKDALK